MRIKRLRYLISGTIFLIIVGILLLWLMRGYRPIESNEVTIEVNGQTTKTFDVAIDGLYPGMSQEYILHIKVSDKGYYNINFTFLENEDAGLKEYLVVNADFGEKTLYYPITMLLNQSEKIEYRSDFSTVLSKDIVVRYSLPIEVGNEAKNTSMDLSLKIQIQKEGI